MAKSKENESKSSLYLRRVRNRKASEKANLSENQWQTLHRVAAHVRRQGDLSNYQSVADGVGRPSSTAVLLHGSNRTAMTLATQILAAELGQEIYRVDMSRVINEYIGETEKNLRRVFAAAEEAGAILLFDEADTIFGKRTKVKDSHDRYANVEVDYLLRLVETYHGLTILTTNTKEAFDPAFVRRMAFVIEFSFPDASTRPNPWKS